MIVEPNTVKLSTVSVGDTFTYGGVVYMLGTPSQVTVPEGYVPIARLDNGGIGIGDPNWDVTKTPYKAVPA